MVKWYIYLRRQARTLEVSAQYMYDVYILKSDCVSWFYVGMSSNTDKRLSQHNAGRVKSTKSKKPFKLIFTKKFNTRAKARDFEKYLKVRSNKEKLLRALKYI